MNKTTVRRRLNLAQLFLIGLLIVGVVMAKWMEHATSNASQRSEKFAAGAERIRLDLAQLSAALPALLLDPKGALDRKPAMDYERDLTDVAEDLERAFGDSPGVLFSLRNLLDFTRGPLSQFHRTTAELLKTNPTAATTYYLENIHPIRDQRDKLALQLLDQVGKVRTAESVQAQTISLIGMVLILVVLAVFLLVGRRQSTAVTEPLEQVTAALERMRQGDFSQRLRSLRADEFGVVAGNLDRLADDLSVLVGQVQRSGIQVNTTATEIAATAREQQSTASQIATTTAEIAATSKEISATSRELDKTMDEVSQVAKATTDLANSGQTGIGRMEHTMHQIINASGAVTSKLAVLSEKTANINSVVTTITKVADQTNLLSLNAAIEAEKAGEYGLGFAVVAMEIRRLADQTAVATYDIEKMVKEMRSAVAAGVMGMDKFSEEVRHGVEEVRQVSTQLAQIIHQVQTLTPRFQNVSEGMHAQATGAQQISETLMHLGEAAQQTAESLRQSNLAIGQLNDAARGLQTSVSRFKLGEA
jgi:methyl-accepting chemotaxis protein WspA